MLNALGYSDLKEFIADVVPADILDPAPPVEALPEGFRLFTPLGQGFDGRHRIENVGGNDISDELLQIAVAQGIQHAELFRFARADMPLRKRRNQRLKQQPAGRS